MEERKRRQDEEIYLFALEILELFDTSELDKLDRSYDKRVDIKQPTN